MHIILLIYIHLIFLTINCNFTNAYDERIVHPGINEKAALSTNLDSKLKQDLGLVDGVNSIAEDKTVMRWLAEGGRLEDDSFRYLRHFHNPLKPWENAGLAGFDSSLVWAQLLDDDGWGHNTSSWSSARRYYYEALKSGSQPDWASTFRSLGQVMHLVSDAAVPAHVRDDPHVLPEKYEAWAAARWKAHSYDPVEVSPSIFSNAAYNPVAPRPLSALWDQDVYDGTNPSSEHVGLAEYTAANFFSEDTLPDDVSLADYPHPSIEDTNFSTIDWKTPELVYEENNTQYPRVFLFRRGEEHEPDGRIALSGYLARDCIMKNYHEISPWVLDERVYEDYAARLIPRAMGYSAALLDYFFRGTIEVKQADLKRHALGAITGVALQMRNASVLGQLPEPMKGGRIDVVCRYRLSGSTTPEYRLATNGYLVSGDSDPINSDFVPVVATFPASIPVGATDLTLTVIYRGKLGSEDDAVAAKVIPLASRIAYSLQPDPYGPSHLVTVRPDGSDPRRIDSPPDSPWNALPSWAAQGALLAFNGISYDGHYDILVVDPLSELHYPDNLKVWLHDPKAHYICPSFNPDGTKIVAHRMLVDPPMDGSDPASSLVVFDLPTGTCSFLGGMDLWLSMTSPEQPKWSPSGSKIVFQLLKGFQGWNAIYNIWSINRDGSNPQGLLNEDFDSRGPVWSPDGKRIVFGSRRDGGSNLDIWIMDSNGANPRMVYDCGESDCVQYAFSPDGTRIVSQMGGGALFTVQLDGEGLTWLPAVGTPSTPTWSPYLFDPPQSP